MGKKINKGRAFRNIVLLTLLAGIVGIYFSNRFVKTKGFDGLGDFITNYRTNRSLASNATPPELTLTISEADYTFVKNKRQEALDRGIQVNKGDNYVSCTVQDGTNTVEGEMRLKGHMTDHLEGDKWSFRVKTEDEIMGMYRFSLQNPATRNYAYEWIYHQLLGHEGIIHLKYDFLNLTLNDQDLGIYAIEEHFGQHILRDNNRPPGAILRWNPELYWEHRLDELDGLYLDESYSNYSSSVAEPYDKGVVKKDGQLIETYQKGASLLEAFRRGEKSTSEVFDVDKMARFHAVIDLVGGYHSLDWSDVKLYYNSETKRIEPVGYESFSVRETVKIAGQRTPEDYATIGFDYHDRLFADRSFFEAYIQHLNRIANPAYFDNFMQTIEAELDQKRGILAHEFAYIKFSLTPYYDNIDRIRHNIELPKPFHAFIQNKTDSTVQLSLTPVSDYPIDILSISIDGKKECRIDSSFTLPPKARNTYAHYFDISFDHKAKKIKNVMVQAKIPGGTTIFEVEAFEFPAADQKEIRPVETAPNSDSALVWVNDSTAILRGNNVNIYGSIDIPENKLLLINPGQHVHFKSGGGFHIAGSLKLLGSEWAEIQVSAEAEVGNCINLEKGGAMIAVYTQFYQLPSNFLIASEGKIDLQKCFIAETKGNFIRANRSVVNLVNCSSGGMESLGFFNRSLVKIKGLVAKNGGTFISGMGSDIEMHSSKIQGFDLVADLNYNSDFSTWASRFESNKTLGKLNNVSGFKTYACEILSGENGFYVDTDTFLPGSSSYLLYSTPSHNLAQVEIKSVG